MVQAGTGGAGLGGGAGACSRRRGAGPQASVQLSVRAEPAPDLHVLRRGRALPFPLPPSPFASQLPDGSRPSIGPSAREILCAHTPLPAVALPQPSAAQSRWLCARVHQRKSSPPAPVLAHRWHAAGRQLCKAASVTDLMACLTTLVDNGYTSAGLIAARAFSAGGITLGAAVNRKPDLFGAVMLQVLQLPSLPQAPHRFAAPPTAPRAVQHLPATPCVRHALASRCLSWTSSRPWSKTRCTC